ncbi:hypothetical protein PUN28_010038 [Cardiocondyla obscurior]|uniref:Uncharacterized protein n=1 Tax=Cardiocondyla obscurior TaxID=286306 RepID=A0AAW2FSN6_9HYME
MTRGKRRQTEVYIIKKTFDEYTVYHAIDNVYLYSESIQLLYYAIQYRYHPFERSRRKSRARCGAWRKPRSSRLAREHRRLNIE